MPVHVRVALLATQAQNVDAFGRHSRRHGLCDAIHHALQPDVLLDIEVVHQPLHMSLGRDQAVAAQGWVSGEERDGVCVLVDQVV